MLTRYWRTGKAKGECNYYKVPIAGSRSHSQAGEAKGRGWNCYNLRLNRATQTSEEKTPPAGAGGSETGSGSIEKTTNWNLKALKEIIAVWVKKHGRANAHRKGSKPAASSLSCLLLTL